MSTPPGRPTIDDVALLLRARTKDTNGVEVGTFDDDTRPTGTEVDRQIDVSAVLVGTRLPALGDLPAGLLDAVAAVVALDAACVIEKSYWPEQASMGDSFYRRLKEERDQELAALSSAAASAVGGTGYTFGFGSVPVGSWTAIA